MRRTDRIPAVIGGTLGLIGSLYVLVYAPMHRNYQRCGKITLCASADTLPKGRDAAGRLGSRERDPSGGRPMTVAQLARDSAE